MYKIRSGSPRNSLSDINQKKFTITTVPFKRLSCRNTIPVISACDGLGYFGIYNQWVVYDLHFPILCAQVNTALVKSPRNLPHAFKSGSMILPNMLQRLVRQSSEIQPKKGWVRYSSQAYPMLLPDLSRGLWATTETIRTWSVWLPSWNSLREDFYHPLNYALLS